MTALHTEYNLRKKSDAKNFMLPEILSVILPTEDDLPYADGEPMETRRSDESADRFPEIILENSRRYYVGGNMFLHFRLNARKKFRGPDFFLVTDVDDRERKSWGFGRKV